MIQPKELQKLGERISKDFLNREIPLTQGLEKVAHDNGLNPNQIDRVAETANIKTHLEFLKTAKNEAYINFELADPTKVKTPLVVKEASSEEDYFTPPVKDNEDFLKEASFYDYEEEEPVKDEKTLYKEASIRRDHVDKLNRDLLDLSASLERKFNPLYSLTKQAALSGIPVDHIQAAISKGTGEPLNEFYIKKLASHLEKDFIDFDADDLTKHASRKINTANPLVKAAREVAETTVELLEKKAEMEEAIENLGDHLIEKQAKEKGLIRWGWEGFTGLLSFTKNNPYIALPAIAGTSGIIYGANREKTKNTKLEKKQIPGRNKSRAF